jgi:hypothetical protein
MKNRFPGNVTNIFKWTPCIKYVPVLAVYTEQLFLLVIPVFLSCICFPNSRYPLYYNAGCLLLKFIQGVRKVTVHPSDVGHRLEWKPQWMNGTKGFCPGDEADGAAAHGIIPGHTWRSHFRQRAEPFSHMCTGTFHSPCMWIKIISEMQKR